MRNHLLTLAVAVVISWLLIQSGIKEQSRSPENSIVVKESAFQRVMRTRVLRCGYVTYFPGLVKDVNTGQFTGFDYDIVTSIAGYLNLKVEWAEEVGWGTALEGLRTNRYDALCVGMWNKPVYNQHALYVIPNFYQPVFAVTRQDETRFDSDLDAINDPNVKIAAIDGDAPVFIAAEDYPKATVWTVPNMTEFSQVMEEVKSRKADVTMVDAPTFAEYNTKNPGQVKLVQTNNPIRIMPCSMAVSLGEHDFKALFDSAIEYLVLSGRMDKILNKYDKTPNSFIRHKKPN